VKKKGRGIATIMFGFGYGEGFPDHSAASIEIQDNGNLLIKSAAADVGQGVLTVLTQIAAEVLKLKTDNIKIIQGDTSLTRNSGSSSATRQTYFSGNAVRLAAEDLLGKIYHYGSLELNSNHPDMEVEDGYIYRLDEADKKISLRELAYRVKDRGEKLEGEGTFFPKTYQLNSNGQSPDLYVAYTFMTQAIDIEVDTETGLIEVLEVYTALDLGKAINPLNVEGQIEGGTIQGMGMALMEEQVIEEGITINPNMTGYLVPTASDIPEFHHTLIENRDADGPFGAKGIGEPTLIAASPAIANAVYDAIGVRIYSLPLAPDKILKALKEKEVSNG